MNPVEVSVTGWPSRDQRMPVVSNPVTRTTTLRPAASARRDRSRLRRWPSRSRINCAGGGASSRAAGRSVYSRPARPVNAAITLATLSAPSNPSSTRHPVSTRTPVTTPPATANRVIAPSWRRPMASPPIIG
ncbi:hypothetical protein D5S17_31000 [Pseudonocardiaceae bacterium YIM PH 21723]|nr:hypothetical protein D5S17_31000 [Pseudonocardiaceae bacterium YIM PH 21723]